jgi:hypothetical protein
MTVPVDELADVIASRLLARAVDLLATPPPGGVEDNRELITRFLSAANLDRLLNRTPTAFREPPPAVGAKEITQTLRTRGQTIANNARAYENRVRQDITDLVAGFDPMRGMANILGVVDLFRARRVVLGDSQLDAPADRDGAIGLLENRRRQPTPPQAGVNLPQVEDLASRRFRFSRTQWADRRVQKVIAGQSAWYAWKARSAWNAAWADQATRWGRTFDQFKATVTALVDAFLEHAGGEPAAFAARTAGLYRNRVGVTYLLPPATIDNFYAEVLNRFIYRDLDRSAGTEADVVTTLLTRAQTWQHAWDRAISTGSAEAGLTAVRDQLRQEVRRLFQQTDVDGRPLLPTMAALLAAAARRDGDIMINEDDLRHFKSKIAGLVPGGFSPGGSGDLKILISYPASGRDRQIERYLAEQIALPQEQDMVVEFRPINAESVAVVLFRTSMSIAEVPELREILRDWAEAVADEQPHDFLKWRQRLGYNSGWLVTSEADRIRVLHHLLCAMWNGQVRVPEERETSPPTIDVLLGGGDDDDDDDRVSMQLALRPFGRTSSWGSLLRAFETWVLADDARVRREFCQQLMRTAPRGINETVSPPSATFRRFVDARNEAVGELKAMRGALPRGSRGWTEDLYEYWNKTVPAALAMPFENVATPVRANLAGLLRMLEDERPGGPGGDFDGDSGVGGSPLGGGEFGSGDDGADYRGRAAGQRGPGRGGAAGSPRPSPFGSRRGPSTTGPSWNEPDYAAESGRAGFGPDYNSRDTRYEETPYYSDDANDDFTPRAGGVGAAERLRFENNRGQASGEPLSEAGAGRSTRRRSRRVNRSEDGQHDTVDDAGDEHR